MQTVKVEAQPDYLVRLANSSSAMAAIAELIWNALDADARDVDVSVRRNDLGGVDRIEVSDNGRGFDSMTAAEVFQRLGGSRKAHRRATEDGRLLHGKQGRGRFRAFALGGKVTWTSRC